MNGARGARLSRRALLAGGIGVGAGLLAGCRGGAEAGAPGGDLRLTTAPETSVQSVTVTRKLSAARYREVDVVIIRPEGVPPSPIPVCVALHPWHGGLGVARIFVDLGVPAMLTELVRGGVPPFAIAAVDGGNWVGHKDDDPQRMLNEDLPEWLDYHELANTPFAAFGVAEGGAGVLNYGRTPGLAAVASVSPSLFENWGDAQRSGVYRDQGQWTASNPFAHNTEFANLPIGVWCGTEDRDFVAPTRKFADSVKAVKTGFGPGGRDNAYWTSALPEVLRFISGYL